MTYGNDFQQRYRFIDALARYCDSLLMVFPWRFQVIESHTSLRDILAHLNSDEPHEVAIV